MASVNKNLTAPRIVGLAAAAGAGVTAFSGTVTANGGFKAAIVAALSAVVLTWIHEEHSTERNSTTAAASMPAAPAPGPMVHPADAAAATQLLGALAAGAAAGQAQAPDLAHSAQPAHTGP